MDEVIQAFLVECHENLDQLDQELVALESESDERKAKNILASIFRKIHTIKGSSGWLGLRKLQSVTHAGENLLSLLREDKIKLTPARTDGLLSMLDSVREILSAVEQTEAEGDQSYEEIIGKLTDLLSDDVPKKKAAAKKAPKAKAEKKVAPKAAAKKAPKAKPEEKVVESEPAEAPPVAEVEPAPVQEPPQVAPPQAEPVAEVVETIEPEVAEAPPEPVAEAPKKEALASTWEMPEESQKSMITKAAGSISEQNIRVDVKLLASIIDLVGELVLTRNQMVQLAASEGESAYTNITQQLNVITTDLQERAMKTRLQPVGYVWNKLPRMVRDLANSCGKRVKLVMEGQETELDKTLLESITDPITHQVRNAIDHGIESPEERIAAGKPPIATIKLKAYHEAGRVNIEISDDGAGINLTKIRKKAIKQGLITDEQAASMSKKELMHLIFKPGFTTSEQVTHISGRGVGMDVVKSSVERIGGYIDIESKRGKGTVFTLKIPLTLAIIPALIVSCGGVNYSISQNSLEELLVLSGEEAVNAVEIMHSTPVYRLRGELLPLVYLNRELKIEDTVYPPGEEMLSIVILSANGKKFGLVVDSIIDNQEIVVKPISKLMKNVPIYSGTTIMGDGTVSLILDVLGLAQKASVISESQVVDSKMYSKDDDSDDGKEQILLFYGPDNSRMALPLTSVSRLEKLKKEDVENTGSLDVIQYGEQILPLVYVSEVITERRLKQRHTGVELSQEDSDFINVIVHEHEDEVLGVVVDRILDIIDDKIEVKLPPSREGIVGSMVLEDQVTELLDLNSIILKAHPTFFRRTKVGTRKQKV